MHLQVLDIMLQAFYFQIGDYSGGKQTESLSDNTGYGASIMLGPGECLINPTWNLCMYDIISLLEETVCENINWNLMLQYAIKDFFYEWQL